jgi:hypothetical protein
MMPFLFPYLQCAFVSVDSWLKKSTRLLQQLSREGHAMIASLRLCATIVFAAVCIMTAGCESVKIGPEDQQRKFALELEPAEKAYTLPELGLALSGGGIRSALFSVGVMKALHDQGILQKVNLVSTVSGGSYAAYWLYSNELSRPTLGRFGSASFDSDVFGQHMCELGTRGNFVTTWDYLKTAFSPTTYPDMYQNHIVHTFGYGDSGERRISDIIAVQPSALPYLIVNATVAESRAVNGWAGGLFEITPLHFGNEHYHYHRWNDRAPSYRKAVGASGAAVAGLLKREFSFIREDGQPLDVVLADGGKSENLGAIALIRRGVKKIIVVDGEHDPGYKLKAYDNLQTRLRDWGLRLHSATLDAHLAEVKEGRKPRRMKTGLHDAYVQTEDGEQVSRIFYLKMADAESIDPMLADTAALHDGEAFNNAYFERLIKTATDDGVFHQRRWHCDKALDVSAHMEPWLKYTLNSYGRFAKRSNVFGFMHRLGGLISAVDSNFPQYTTADQSFYLDQNMAFIALGYFEGLELKAVRQEVLPVAAVAN